jgi:hypothetical protein
MGVDSGAGNFAGNTTTVPGQFVFRGGNNVTISQITGVTGGNTIVISGPNTAAQTTQTFNVYATGNTISTNSTIAAEAGTGITYAASGGLLVGVSNGSVVFSQGTGTTFNGNLLGGSLTLSTGGLQVSLSHPAWLTTARASTDAIGLNTAQTNVTWTVNSSGLSFNAGGYAGTTSGTTATTTAGTDVKLSITNNSAGINLSFGVPAWLTTAMQSNESHVLNIVAATNSTGGGVSSQSSNVSFSNGNGVSFFMTNGAVVASVAAAGGAQTGISGMSAGTETSVYTSGTVGFSNLNGITFRTSTAAAMPQGIYITHALAGTGTSITGNASITLDSAGLKFNGSNLAGVGTSITGNASITLDSAGLKFNGSGLAGTSTGFGGNLISGSITLNSSGLNLSLNHPAWLTTQTNQTVGVYGSSQTTGSASSGTHDARSMSFIGAGIISIGNHSTSVGGTTTGIVISATQSNQAVSNSAGSFTFQTLNFSNANNVTWGTSAGGIVTASVAAPGAAAENNWFSLLGANTAGNATASGSTVGLSGINVTLSGTNNSQIVISAAAQSVQWTGAGMGDQGGTFGTTGFASTRLMFAGSNGIVLSQSIPAGGAATMTIMPQLQSYYEPPLAGQTSAHTLAATPYLAPFRVDAPITAVRMQMLHSLSTVNTTRITVSYSFSSQTSTAHSASYGQSDSYWLLSRKITAATAPNYSQLLTFMSSSLSQSAGITLNVTWSTNVSTATGSASWSARYGGYLLNIDSDGVAVTTSGSSSSSTSGSSTSTNQNSSSFNFSCSWFSQILSGVRPFWLPIGSTLSPGEYWIAMARSTQTGTTGGNYGRSLVSVTNALIGLNVVTANQYANLGETATVTSQQFWPGLGSWQGGTAGGTTDFTTTLGITAIGSGNNRPWFNILGNPL